MLRFFPLATVPLITGLFALQGCAIHHRVEERDAAGNFDAGPVPTTDAGPVVIDAGPMECVLERPSSLCLPDSLIPPRLPSEVTLHFTGECLCGEVVCEVDVDENINITTRRCGGDSCTTCAQTQEVVCALPRVEASVRTLFVNGVPSALLRFDFDTGFRQPGPYCVGLAEQSACEDPSLMEASNSPVHEACAIPAENGRYELELTDECHECPTALGPCEVQLLRDPMGGPERGRLVVNPQHYPLECQAACPEVCMRRERRCLTPPLEPNSTYVIEHEGRPVSVFVADGSGTCAP